MGMMYSKIKPTTISDFVVEDNNTKNDWNNHDCKSHEYKYCKR
jgi:hypothetical protein